MAENSLRDQLLMDIKVAMKSKQDLKLQALRLVHAELKNQEIEQKKPVTDMQMVSILKKQIKQYEESLVQYEKANRPEGAKEQKEKMQIIQSYLPKPLSEEELKSVVNKVISQLQVSSAKQMGMVIKEVQLQTSGSADNRQLVALVKERLQNL